MFPPAPHTHSPYWATPAVRRSADPGETGSWLITRAGEVSDAVGLGIQTRRELGNGSTASSDVPVRVALPAGVRATAVSAEEETSLARTSGGGGLFGWRDNSLGQLGDGTTTSSDTPVRVDLPSG